MQLEGCWHDVLGSKQDIQTDIKPFPYDPDSGKRWLGSGNSTSTRAACPAIHTPALPALGYSEAVTAVAHDSTAVVTLGVLGRCMGGGRGIPEYIHIYIVTSTAPGPIPSLYCHCFMAVSLGNS